MFSVYFVVDFFYAGYNNKNISFLNERAVVFTKFVSLGERRRSLNQTIEFVTFVQFVVERKESNCFLE